MRKGIIWFIAFVSFSCVANAQTPAEAPKPTVKEVAVSADQQVAILKAQRALQGAQIQQADRRQKAIEAEQKLEQQDEANIKQTIAELNAQVEKARIELKLPANTPFDQMKLAFTVPAAK